MFQQRGLLEHVLPPEAYRDDAWYRRERAALFEDGWHLAATAHDVAEPGSHVAITLGETPVVVRNAGGRLRAFENVCAHRHCQVVPPGRGRGARLRCPYHGWEYGDDGGVAHVPDGPSFRGIKLQGVGLRELRCERIGDLVFVSRATVGGSLRDELGDFAAELERFFGETRRVWSWTTEHPVNWKVIAENAVESYHVPVAHPSTFAAFRPEELHDHRLAPSYTRYVDRKPWTRRPVERALVRAGRWLLPGGSVARFTQAHVFPGFLLYYNELFASFIALEPLGPTRTRHVQLGFVPREIRAGALPRVLQAVFARVFVPGVRRVMREDMALWPRIQAGLSAARGGGFLSAREERVHAFQRYVAARLDDAGREEAREERDAGAR